MKNVTKLIVLPALAMSTAATSQYPYPGNVQCREVEQQYYDRCFRENWFGSPTLSEREQRCRGVARDEYERCAGLI